MSDVVQPKLLIQKQEIFGIEGVESHFAVIGTGNTEKEGRQVSKDIEEIQSHASYKLGLQEIAEDFNKSKLIPLEVLNSMFYMDTYQIAYLQQAGIAEWKANIVYPQGAIIKGDDGRLYTSLEDVSEESAKAGTNEFPGTNWVEIPQFTELNLLADSLTREARTLLGQMQNIVTDYENLEILIKAAVPVGMIYMQHLGTAPNTAAAFPEDLFGGSWEVYQPSLESRDSPKLRYETPSLGFPGNRRVLRDYTTSYRTYTSDVWGHRERPEYWPVLAHKQGDRGATSSRISEYDYLPFIPKSDFNDVGQTFRLWIKTGHPSS